MMKKLLLISLYVALVFTAAGNEVYCNSSSDPKSCGPAGSGTWVQGSESYKFKISDCSAIGDSPQGIFDTFCASCPFGKSSNVPKIRMLNEGFQYAIRLQTECTNIAPEPGVPVDCQSKSSCSNCGNPPSLAFIWDISGESTTQCQIRSCLAAPIPTSGINDNFCISCGKTNKFANSDGSACVNPTGGNCSRQSAWNDEDCKICNENSANSAKVKASADKTSCISASNSILISSSILMLALITTYLLF